MTEWTGLVGSNSAIPDIKLYLLHHSQALRILWLLKLLQLPYTLVSIPRRKDRVYPELQALSSAGKAPVLVIGDEVITESRLCAKALTALRPIQKTPADAKKDAYFQEMAGASLTPAVHMCLIFDVMYRASPWLLRPLVGAITGAILGMLKKELDPYMDIMDTHLLQHDYLGGTELGVSDVLMTWPIDLSVAKNFVDLSRWKGVQAWHTRIKSMESYKSAVQESGGYDLANLGV